MRLKRKYVRVPLSGEAILSTSRNQTIKARTINISEGGVAVTDIFSEEIPSGNYQIEILTEAGQRIELFAQRVRFDDHIAGFQTLWTDQNGQEFIRNLVFEYEKTTAFIKQLDEFNLLDDKVVDEEGHELEITFEKDSDGNQ